MVNATAADSSARVTGAGSISLQNTSTDIIITVTAQNGNVRTYTIHVVKQDGGPTSGSTGSPVSPGGSSGTGSPGGSGSPGGPGSSGGPGGFGGPGGSGPADSGSTPGGSNVTIVQVQS